MISLRARQYWHFPAHSPFILRHVLQYTLRSISAELLLRCIAMHSWMASCPPNGTKNNVDKMTSRGKVNFLICDIHVMSWKPPGFPQEKKQQCDLEVDRSFLFINNFTLITCFSILWHVCAQLLHPCPTLCDPMDCNLPGSSDHGILQARRLEWVAMPSSRGSSRSRKQPTSPALQADSLPLSHQESPTLA